VTAPLAGVFYRASKPGEKPYVESGQKVKKGDTVGLIEAMKMMSEIPAPCSGVVETIEVKDSDFAAYGTTLMYIREN
jgi:acetyl-CoA carboxylase biotin carboxyl carrier protein